MTVGTHVIFLLLLSFITVLIQQQYVHAQECNEHCQFEVQLSNKIGTKKDNNEKYAFFRNRFRWWMVRRHIRF